MSVDLEAARRALAAARALHAPVMLAEVIAALTPARGVGPVLDGTFGAGGYACALLDRGAAVIGVDRDPEAIGRAAGWAALYGDRLRLVEGRFGDLDAHADGAGLGGVTLDLGVSSMQLDQAERGFSFQKDGPLDMRMARADGPSAADLVNEAGEADLADVLFHYGEERASRRIAKAILAARRESRIETTLRLAEIVAGALPRPKPGQPHSATRSFQAIRISVNDELGELARGLAAAERALAPGGVLAVVSFHSLEDRMVKRFLQARSGKAPRGSRYSPEVHHAPASFQVDKPEMRAAGEAEIAANPRARSAKLRAATRAAAPPLAEALAEQELAAAALLGGGRRRRDTRR